MDETGKFQRYRLIIVASVMMALLAPTGWTQLLAQPRMDPVSVVRDDISLDFPQGLNFRLELDSASAVSKADLLFSVGENRTLIQTSAQLADSTDGVIDHFVNMRTLGIPTGLTLSYHWRLQSEAGQIVETPISQTEWFDDRYEWTAYNTEDIVLYAYSGEDDFNDSAAQVGQDALSALQDRFDAPARFEPLRIWLYESQSDMSGALSPNSREWIGGVSYARYSLIAAVVPSGSDYAIQRVIPHEVAHQIIYDATHNPFVHPATWLDEGIAMAVQTVDLEGLDAMVEDAYLDGTLPSVQSMISEFGSDGGSTRLAYASSYSVVMFIEETMGAEMIDGLVAAYADGRAHDDTLMSVLSIDTMELNRLWRESIESQING